MLNLDFLQLSSWKVRLTCRTCTTVQNANVCYVTQREGAYHREKVSFEEMFILKMFQTKQSEFSIRGHDRMVQVNKTVTTTQTHAQQVLTNI